MTPEEVEKKMKAYDQLFKEASEFDRLCEIEGASCLAGKFPCCIVQPGEKRANCDQLDPSTGCRVNTVMCKIWFCGAARRKHPELDEHIQSWGKRIAELPGILFFQSRDDYKRSLERI